jgi:hypothetical protein
VSQLTFKEKQPRVFGRFPRLCVCGYVSNKVIENRTDITLVAGQMFAVSEYEKLFLFSSDTFEQAEELYL